MGLHFKFASSSLNCNQELFLQYSYACKLLLPQDHFRYFFAKVHHQSPRKVTYLSRMVHVLSVQDCWHYRHNISCGRKPLKKCFSGFVRFVCFLKIQEALDAAFELMGQQYSFVVKVLHDHALVLKDLAVLNQEGLASKRLVYIVSWVKLWLQVSNPITIYWWFIWLVSVINLSGVMFLERVFSLFV